MESDFAIITVHLVGILARPTWRAAFMRGRRVFARKNTAKLAETPRAFRVSPTGD